MYHVYILESIPNKGRHYVGHAEEVGVRLERHNKGKVRSTKPYKPWKIVRIESFERKQDAYRRELQIKSYKGGEAFKKLIREK